jgi:hypothetical protein
VDRLSGAAGTRVALIMAIGVATIAAAAFALTRTGTAPTAAGDPRTIAEAWLRSESEATCFEAPTVDYYLPPTIAKADELPGVDRWLEPGTDWGYVGDINRATFGLERANVARAANEAWVMGYDDGGAMIVRYQSVTTPKGRSLWYKAGWERPMAAEACRS